SMGRESHGARALPAGIHWRHRVVFRPRVPEALPGASRLCGRRLVLEFRYRSTAAYRVLGRRGPDAGPDRRAMGRPALLLTGESNMRWPVALAALAWLAATSALAGAPQTVVLDVQNMTCALCPVTVKKSLQQVPGVADAKIDLEKKTATVKFDPDRTSVAAL